MIELTQLEFTLLLNNDHPFYDASAEDEHLESGKGADVHYTREIIRKKDNKKLSITITFNHSFEGYQDWIRGGDFEIDDDKEEVFDECGEQLQSEKKQEVEQKIDTNSVSFRYESMIKTNNIPDCKDNNEWQTAPVDVITELFLLSKSVIQDIPEHRKVPFNKLSIMFYEAAIKYKFNVHRAWEEIFTNKPLRALSEKRFSEYYRIQHELLAKGTVTFKLGGQDIELTKKELKMLGGSSTDAFNSKYKRSFG